MLIKTIRFSSRTSLATIRCAAFVALALGVGRAPEVFSQTTPNWGEGATQGHPVSSTTSASPWGGTSTAAPVQPGRSNSLPGKANHAAASVEPIPPALAAILKRPDTDTVTLAGGQST